MTDNANDKTNEKVESQGSEEVVATPTGPEGQVVLTPQQYAEMVDYIAAVEAKLMHAETTPKTDPLDDILKRTSRRESEDQVDLDEMSNTQLAKFILGEIDSKAVNIQTELETIKVLREIDKCEAKFPDFHDYVDRVYQLGRENPTLSIEKAYKLAKQEAGEDKGKSKTENVRGLPPRPSALRSTGEHPGRTVTSTPTKVSSQGVASLTQAAEKAWEDANKE